MMIPYYCQPFKKEESSLRKIINIIYHINFKPAANVFGYLGCVRNGYVKREWMLFVKRVLQELLVPCFHAFVLINQKKKER